MIREKDYLMRMLLLFLERLSELLLKKHITEISDDDLKFFYDTITNNQHEKYETDSNDFVAKCRMLAEIWYIETLRNKDGKQREYATKSLEMFDLYNQKTKIYDFEIIEKINNLKEIIENQKI